MTLKEFLRAGAFNKYTLLYRNEGKVRELHVDGEKVVIGIKCLERFADDILNLKVYSFNYSNDNNAIRVILQGEKDVSRR